jgi:cullin 3
MLKIRRNQEYNFFLPFQSATPNCNIPPAPRRAFETFKRFYLAKHSGRQLTLQPQLGSTNITIFVIGKLISYSPSGTVYMNAEFYGAVKPDKDLEGACSSTAGPPPIPTSGVSPRRHVLQLSTYQVSLFCNTKSLIIHFHFAFRCAS